MTHPIKMSLAKPLPIPAIREPIKVSVRVRDSRDQIWEAELSGIHEGCITLDHLPLHFNQERERVTVFLKLETQELSDELTIQTRIRRIEHDTTNSWDLSANLVFLEYNTAAWKRIVAAIESEQSKVEKILDYIKNG